MFGLLIGFPAERNSTMFSFDGSSLFFLQDAAKANSNTSRYNDVFFIFEIIPQLRCLTFCFDLQDNKVLQGFAILKISTGLGCGKSKQVKNLLSGTANVEI